MAEPAQHANASTPCEIFVCGETCFAGFRFMNRIYCSIVSTPQTILRLGRNAALTRRSRPHACADPNQQVPPSPATRGISKTDGASASSTPHYLKVHVTLRRDSVVSECVVSEWMVDPLTSSTFQTELTRALHHFLKVHKASRISSARPRTIGINERMPHERVMSGRTPLFGGGRGVNSTHRGGSPPPRR